MMTDVRDQAVLNRIWSQLVLEELVRFGVEHVCIAPGSRSTPLTLEADENKQLTIHTHFDERGLAFHALGMAKASRKPVAIVVTSGTAVANLLPAIAESGLTGEQLVVLTADRPIELIDCGANQAISQTTIFSQHITDSLNLPSPSEQVSPKWLLTSVDQLMQKQSSEGGSVHINFPFPEPLYSETQKSIYSDYLSPVSHWYNSAGTYSSCIPIAEGEPPGIASLEEKKGLIIIGQMDLSESVLIKRFADRLGWPVVCDPQSGASSTWRHFDMWLQNQSAKEELAKCDLILQFGARLVSKRLNTFINAHAVSTGCYYLVSAEKKRLNPDHLPQIHLRSDPKAWLQKQTELLGEKNSLHFGWANHVQQFSEQVALLSQQLFLQQSNQLSELNIASTLGDTIGGHDLFIGNSLIIRLIDMISSLKGNRVYTNRGASGIDGLVATAAGALKITQQPMAILVGDTSLLYDLNSLSLFSSTDVPVVILVCNNDGGAIFDLLPVPEQKRQSLYQMPHGYQFQHAALQFNLAYLNPSSMEELVRATQAHLEQGSGALLLEVNTLPGDASSDIKKLVKQVHAIH